MVFLICDRTLSQGLGVRRQVYGPELMMSPEPLQRHELVDATLWVSQYGHVDLARQCLQEMSRRAMRPSLDAHNAVLKALALQHKWSTATHVLLRMEQHELEPPRGQLLTLRERERVNRSAALQLTAGL